MSEPRTIMTGIVFGESPRWHDGRLWFSDWARQEIITVTPSGHSETVLSGPDNGFGPACIDWLPDGRLLLVSGRRRALLRREADGTLTTHADLSTAFGDEHWNEVNVDSRGNAFVNNIGFTFPGGEFAPGIVAVVTPDGSARVVAEGFGFPNGMAVTPDDSTLIVAESYAHQLTAFDIAPDGGLSNRRVWAYLGDAAAPDGITLDAEGAVWYADVPNQHCRRVAEGGKVLQTVEADLGCFSCALGGGADGGSASTRPGAEGGSASSRPGADGGSASSHPVLYIVAADWSKGPEMFSGPPTGKILAVDVPVAGVYQ